MYKETKKLGERGRDKSGGPVRAEKLNQLFGWPIEATTSLLELT